MKRILSTVFASLVTFGFFVAFVQLCVWLFDLDAKTGFVVSLWLTSWLVPLSFVLEFATKKRRQQWAKKMRSRLFVYGGKKESDTTDH